MAPQHRKVHPGKGRLTIIDQLRRATAGCGESQSEIARQTGIDRAMLNQFIRGERSLSLESAAKLCQYLGLALKGR
jgi:transcriptional regulator with XRE-family HTH domain